MGEARTSGSTPALASPARCDGVGAAAAAPAGSSPRRSVADDASVLSAASAASATFPSAVTAKSSGCLEPVKKAIGLVTGKAVVFDMSTPEQQSATPVTGGEAARSRSLTPGTHARVQSLEAQLHSANQRNNEMNSQLQHFSLRNEEMGNQLKHALEQIAALQRAQEAAAAMGAAEGDIDMASSIASSIGPSASAVAENIARRNMDVDLTDYNVVLRRRAGSTEGSTSAASAAPPATVAEAIREIDEVVTEILAPDNQETQSTVTAMEFENITGDEE